MVKLKIGDEITFPKIRPFHWNKKGLMDKYLGKTFIVRNVYDKPENIQRIWFDGSDNWEFFNTDLLYSSRSIFEIGDVVQLRKSFKIFRDFGSGEYDICDLDGNCLKVKDTEIFLSQLNNEQTMKAMKDAVLTVAKGLAKANNTVTTLEIKNELRRDYPYFYWTQDVVSKYMDQLAGDNVFTYTDNGTYRIYSLANGNKTAGPVTKSLAKSVKKAKNKTKAISQFDAVDLAYDKDFEGVTIKRRIGNIYYSTYDIKSMKKSANSFMNNAVGKIVAVTVKGKNIPCV